MATDESASESSVLSETRFKVDASSDLSSACNSARCSPAPDAEHAQEFFEGIYEQANGDPARVPWADCRACPVVVEWLNTEAPLLVRPGCRAVVVGCGLGDDLIELTERGYDVMGFDISPTAVRWAARRHPSYADRFMLGDLLKLPPRLVRRFDLVVEAYTLQSMDPGLRVRAGKALEGLMSARGAVVVVCKGRAPGQSLADLVNPPYGFTPDELLSCMREAGLGLMREERGVERVDHPHEAGSHCLRAVFTRL